MEENKTPEETLETADTTEETVATEAEETTEETTEEYVTTNEEETSEQKASKKTTIVLVTMILILIALIVFVGVLIFNKIRKDKEEAEQQAQIESLLSDVDDAATQSQTTDTVEEKVEYHVEVTLGEYKGIEAAMVIAEVTDEEINEEIQSFCENLSEEIEVTDRAVEDGDLVNIDYAGYMDDEQFEGGTDEGYDLYIGSGTFIDGFEEGLIGHAVGEIVDVNVTFPDPYDKNPDFSGKPALFRVTINSIVEERIPEFSDELVAANTEFSTMEEYINYVREDLESMNLEDAQTQFKNDVIAEVISRCTFGGQIEEQIAEYVKNYKDYNDYLGNSYYGVDGATLFLYFYGMDADSYEAYILEQATYEAKYAAVLDKIIEVENLTVTEEEYDSMFNEIFIDYYGYSSREEVLLDAPEEEIDEMVNTSILQDKAMQIIIDNAVVIE